MKDRKRKRGFVINHSARKCLEQGAVVFCLLFGAGCANTVASGNIGNLQSYSIPTVEAQWIRNGEPIDFEGALWYPADGIEVLRDSEVYLVAEYRGLQVFADRIDVRPYDRLYTKFGKNKFRYFKQRKAR